MGVDKLEEAYNLLFDSDLRVDTKDELSSLVNIIENNMRKQDEINKLRNQLVNSPYNEELRRLIKKKEMFINLEDSNYNVSILESELKDLIQKLYVAYKLD